MTDTRPDQLNKNIEAELNDRWGDFLDRNAVAIRKLAQRDYRLVSSSSDDETIARFLSWMVESRPTAKPLAEDLEALRNVVSGIIDVQKQAIVNEDEAKALVDFVFGRFIERRMERITQLLPMGGESRRWFYGHHKLTK